MIKGPKKKKSTIKVAVSTEEVVKTIVSIFFQINSHGWTCKEFDVYHFCLLFSIGKIKEVNFRNFILPKYSDIVERVISISHQDLHPFPPSSKKFEWIPSLDNRMFAGIITFGYDWNKIASCFVNVTPEGIRHHWEGLCDKNSRRFCWSFIENIHFRALLNLPEEDPSNIIYRKNTPQQDEEEAKFIQQPYIRQKKDPDFEKFSEYFLEKSPQQCKYHFMHPNKQENYNFNKGRYEGNPSYEILPIFTPSSFSKLNFHDNPQLEDVLDDLLKSIPKKTRPPS